jgi:tetratricopeptide (TPR) repeat protein
MQAAWDALNKSPDPSRRTIGQTLSVLGEAQLEVQMTADAIRSLEEAIPILKEVQPTPTPEQADAWIALARARLSLGQVDASLSWAEMADRFWIEFDPHSPFAGEAAFWLGTALERKGDHQLARQHLARATTLLQPSPWPSQRMLLAQAGKIRVAERRSQ